MSIDPFAVLTGQRSKQPLDLLMAAQSGGRSGAPSAAARAFAQGVDEDLLRARDTYDGIVQQGQAAGVDVTPDPSRLERFFRTVDAPRAALFATGAELFSEDGPTLSGWQERFDERQGFGQVLRTDDPDASLLERGARGAAGFILDAATDPLTYVTGGAAIGRKGAAQLAERTMPRALHGVRGDIDLETLQRFARQTEPAKVRSAVEQQVRRNAADNGVDLTDAQVRRIVDQRMGGNFGDLTNTGSVTRGSAAGRDDTNLRVLTLEASGRKSNGILRRIDEEQGIAVVEFPRKGGGSTQRNMPLSSVENLDGSPLNDLGNLTELLNTDALWDLGSQAIGDHFSGLLAAYGPRRARRWLEDALGNKEVADQVFAALPTAAQGGARINIPFLKEAVRHDGSRRHYFAWSGDKASIGFGGGGALIDRIGLGAIADAGAGLRLGAQRALTSPSFMQVGRLGTDYKQMLDRLATSSGDEALVGWGTFRLAREIDQIHNSTVAQMSQSTAESAAVARQAYTELDETGKAEFARLYHTVDGEQLADLAEQGNQAALAAVTLKARIDDLHSAAREVGVDVGYLDNYTNRVLTEDGKRWIRNRELAGSGTTGVEGPTATKQRTGAVDGFTVNEDGTVAIDGSKPIPQINAELRDEVGGNLFHDDPFVMFADYTDSMSRVIANYQVRSHLQQQGLVATMLKVSRVDAKARAKMQADIDRLVAAGEVSISDLSTTTQARRATRAATKLVSDIEDETSQMVRSVNDIEVDPLWTPVITQRAGRFSEGPTPPTPEQLQAAARQVADEQYGKWAAVKADELNASIETLIVAGGLEESNLSQLAQRLRRGPEQLDAYLRLQARGAADGVDAERIMADWHEFVELIERIPQHVNVAAVARDHASRLRPQQQAASDRLLAATDGLLAAEQSGAGAAERVAALQLAKEMDELIGQQLAASDRLLMLALSPEQLPDSPELWQRTVESIADTLGRQGTFRESISDVDRMLPNHELKISQFFVGDSGEVPAAFRELLGAEPVRRAVTRRYETINNPSGPVADWVEKIFQPYMTLFRVTATVGRGPGFVSRNVMGGIWNNWLMGVPHKDHTLAAQMLGNRMRAHHRALDRMADEGLISRPARRGVWESFPTDANPATYFEYRNRELRDLLGNITVETPDGRMPLHEVLLEWEATNLGTRTQDALLPSGAGAQRLASDPIAELGLRDRTRLSREAVGARTSQTFSREQIEQASSPSARRAMEFANAIGNNRWINAMSDMSASSEDFLRGAAFITGMRRYNDTDAANLLVKSAHFDYGDLSEWERKIARNILPFWTWSKNNVPLQMRAVLTDPGRVSRLLHANERLKDVFGLQDEEEAAKINGELPVWQRERFSWATRYSFGGNPITFGIESPVLDINRDIQREVFGSANPLLKSAVELGSGRNLFTGAQFDERGIEVPAQWGPLAALLEPAGLSYQAPDGQRYMNEWLYSTMRDIVPPVGQAERLAPVGANDVQRERLVSNWLSQMAGMPVATVTERQQRGELRARTSDGRAQIDRELRKAGVDREWVRTLLDAGYSPAQIQEILERRQQG